MAEGSFDLSNISRLQEEHERAIHSCQESINKWQKFKSEYEAVESTLQTLPEKVSHDIMVPFGSLAFMPGKLVHTNEILVLLGDNWFAKRSAMQAQQIVDRRKDYCCKYIDDLEKEMNEIRSRKAFTTDFQAAAKESGFVEIAEKMPDEKQERQPRTAHQKTKTLGGTKKAFGKDAEQKKSTKHSSMSVQEENNSSDVFTRLEELEKQECENKELDKLEDTGNTFEMDQKVKELMKSDKKTPILTKKVAKTSNMNKLNKPSVKSTVRRSVSLDAMSKTCSKQKQVGIKISHADRGHLKEESVDKNGGSSEEDEPRKSIIFMHSKLTVTSSVSADNLQETANSFKTPGDIYKRFLSEQKTEQSLGALKPPLKSILKSPSVENLDFANGISQTAEEKRVKFQNVTTERLPPRPASTKPGFYPEKAFTGRVYEHASSANQIQQESVAPMKRVSKFKASRPKSR